MPVVFGAYNPLLFSDLLAQSSLSVTCIGLGTARINLLAGWAGAASRRAPCSRTAPRGCRTSCT
ncbi:hypothetical protein HK414_06040 [Ramlibacter terrae]|uniref:Uncharacterized protein n=1 Tax=Ramlibacter terrae TaxID=2732511 RepID=A0ABX6P0Y8_9BURK|nr:hypothetical protein HK414_06040 [Ramlibacter terrae]